MEGNGNTRGGQSLSDERADRARQAFRCRAVGKPDRLAPLSEKHRFALELICARLGDAGLTNSLSDDERHLLNEIESRLFDLDGAELAELEL